MKKVIDFCIVLLVATTPLKAQSVSRNSAPLPEFSEPLSMLREAVGWYYTDAKQWVGNNNAISQDDIDADGALLRYHLSKNVNFSTIEIRTVNIGSAEYLILMKHHVDGAYEYPAIYEGWYDFDAISFCVFSHHKLTLLKEAISQTNKASSVDLGCIAGDQAESRWESILGDILTQIKKKVAKQYSGEAKHNLHIDLFPVVDAGLKVVRFRWDVDYNIGSYRPDRTFKSTVFDESYYEVDYTAFEHLISLDFPESFGINNAQARASVPVTLDVYGLGSDGYASVSIKGNRNLGLQKGFDQSGGGCHITIGSRMTFGMKRGHWTNESVGRSGDQFIIRDSEGEIIFAEQIRTKYGDVDRGNPWPEAEQASQASWQAAPDGSIEAIQYGVSTQARLFGFRKLWKWGIEHCDFPNLESNEE